MQPEETMILNRMILNGWDTRISWLTVGDLTRKKANEIYVNK